MRTKKTILLILTFVMLITILYATFSLRSSLRPSVPLDDLLITNPSFPTKWDSGEIPVRVVNWQQTDNFNNSTVVSLAPCTGSLLIRPAFNPLSHEVFPKIQYLLAD